MASFADWDFGGGVSSTTDKLPYDVDGESSSSDEEDGEEEEYLEVVKELKGHTGTVNAIAISEDGLSLYSGGADKSVLLWEISSGSVTSRLILEGHSTGVRSLAATGDNQFLFSCCKESIKVWRLDTGACSRTLKKHSDRINDLKATEDCKWLVSASDDDTAIVWDLASRNVHKVLKGHKSAVTCVAISSKRVYTGSEDKTIKMWNLTTGKCTKTLKSHIGDITCLALAEGEDWLFTGAGFYDKTVRMWDAKTGRMTKVFSGHSGGVSAVAASWDGEWLFSSSVFEVLVWNPRVGEPDKRPKLLQRVNLGGDITQMKLSADQTILYVAGDSKKITLHKTPCKPAPLKKLFIEIPPDEGEAAEGVFSPDENGSGKGKGKGAAARVKRNNSVIIASRSPTPSPNAVSLPTRSDSPFFNPGLNNLVKNVLAAPSIKAFGGKTAAETAPASVIRASMAPKSSQWRWSSREKAMGVGSIDASARAAFRRGVTRARSLRSDTPTVPSREADSDEKYNIIMRGRSETPTVLSTPDDGPDAEEPESQPPPPPLPQLPSSAWGPPAAESGSLEKAGHPPSAFDRRAGGAAGHPPSAFDRRAGGAAGHPPSAFDRWAGGAEGHPPSALPGVGQRSASSMLPGIGSAAGDLYVGGATGKGSTMGSRGKGQSLASRHQKVQRKTFW